MSENLADDGSCAGVAAGITVLAAAATDNGGPTFTHALLAGSQALDAAPSGISNDQRGFAIDGTRDIGAYEAQIPVVMAPTDMSFEATGPLTSPALGTATVLDVDEPTLIIATPSQTNDFVVGNTVVTWSATDAYGHIGIDDQNVTVVDTTPPVLSLIGANPISLLVGDTYIDAGVIATDLVDDDAVLTSNVIVNNLPNTSFAGSYTVRYDVSDNAGNAATKITRKVNVLVNIGVTLSGLTTGNNVILQNNAADDLVLSDNGVFTFSTALEGGSSYAVTVFQQPVGQSCFVINGSGTVSGGHVTDVSVMCSENTISLSSTSLNYGTVFSGDQVTNVITVTNTGSSDVVISGLTDPVAPFSLVGGSCTVFPRTLTAGDSCEIEVLFNPIGEGSFNDSFQIISNATSSPDEITLFGSSGLRVVPTLSQWTMMFMSLLMLVMAYRNRQDFY